MNKLCSLDPKLLAYLGLVGAFESTGACIRQRRVSSLSSSRVIRALDHGGRDDDDEIARRRRRKRLRDKKVRRPGNYVGQGMAGN